MPSPLPPAAASAAHDDRSVHPEDACPPAPTVQPGALPRVLFILLGWLAQFRQRSSSQLSGCGAADDEPVPEYVRAKSDSAVIAQGGFGAEWHSGACGS
jgi:hypothetical protein